MKPLRACPLCPRCGSKKFERIKDDFVSVKCVKCGKILQI